VVALVLVSLPARADTASQLKSAEARLNTLIGDIAAATKQRSALQVQLDALAAEVSRTQSALDLTQGDIDRTQAAIVVTEQEIGSLTRQIQVRRGILDQRAVVAYEAGPASGIEFLLGASSTADLQDRIVILDAAAQSDADLIAGMQQQTATLHAKQAELAGLQGQLRSRETQLLARRADLQTQQDDLGQKFAQQRVLLSKLAADRSSAESLVARLKATRLREIEAARLAAAQTARSAGGAPGPSFPGVLNVCPVDQPRAYSDDFGAPRVGHLHMGIDIMAPSGTPIRAPFAGTAIDGSDPGGGNDVFVYGRQGYVFNAHLSSYGAAGPVSAGAVIGYVGATGDATGPHDHFEWHPNVIPRDPWVSPYGYSVINGAIDAYPYLNAVC